METKIIKTINIKTIEDWFCAAPPQGGKRQWKKGYSAKELATFVIENQSEFQDLIQDVINETGIKRCNTFVCEPEASTQLPYSHRGPRKHDLLLRNKNVIIGIEAKAEEPFGDDRKGSKNKEKRLKWMQEMLFPNTEENDIKDIPYQLLTGICGTLLEAKRPNEPKESKDYTKNCIFLVLIFKQEKENKNKKTIENLNNIIEKLDADKGITIEVKEPGEAEGKPIRCWVKKRIIEIPAIRIS